MDNQVPEQSKSAFSFSGSPQAPLNPNNHPPKSVAVLVLLSFIFGTLGGLFGGIYLAHQPKLAKYFLGSSAATTNQTVNLTEDSAIINVVKKSSPAVVSVIISQDLNKIPGYGLNPYDNSDPFFNFFFNGGQQPQQQNPSTPNIQQVGAGTGFFISADGLIVTNKHVVSDAQASYTVLTTDGKKYDAKVVAQDPVDDLAIVKVDVKDAPFLSFADSSNLQVGQRVIAIGNSLGQYQNTVTSGIVSGIGRQITAGGDAGSEELSGVIQTDAAINPGNSGGPLLNADGQVVGINTAIDQQGQLVGFAIPSNDISKAVASFQKNGKISRPFLGVRYIMLSPEISSQQKLPKNYGALIVRGQNTTDFAVIPGSPADKAGLMENDIIMSVNGKNLDDKNTLSDALKDYNPSDSIKLHIYHKGEEKDVTVTLSESQ